MTQLGELRDAYPRFREAGVKLYAVSYDDHAAQAAFAEANQIPFPLLSDADSAVIRRYGILNTLVREDEVPFHGIPFPGTYVVDERGVVVEKFFPRHLANRESADSVLESALGELLMGEQEPALDGWGRRRADHRVPARGRGRAQVRRPAPGGRALRAARGHARLR